MKISERLSEMIDQYLAGVLDGEELAEFTALRNRHPELEEEIKLHRFLRNTARVHDEIELRRKLEVLHRNYVVQQKPVVRRVLIKWSKVAAVAAIIVAGAWIINTKLLDYNYSNEELFTMYYQPYEMQVFRSAAEDNLFKDAVEKYNSRDFEQAITLFEKVIEADQERMDANLMSGMSKIEVKKYSDANTNFQKIIDHSDNLYIEHAEWYLALCYLMTSDTEKAREQLLKIVLKDGYYSKDAAKVLRKMKV